MSLIHAWSQGIIKEHEDTITRLTAEVERLKLELNDTITELEWQKDRADSLGDGCQQFKDENERLRGALAPFASIQSQMGDYVGYPDSVIVRIEASVGEIRRARAALTQEPHHED